MRKTEKGEWYAILAAIAMIVGGSLVLLLGLTWLCIPVQATLQEDISTAPYTINSYQLHKFDCTDMSAIMVTHLDNLDYDARIQTFRGTGIIGHAMVIVYDHTNYTCTLIETTRKTTTTQYPHGMELEGEYTDVIGATENSRWGASEWGMELYLSERAITERKGERP